MIPVLGIPILNGPEHLDEMLASIDGWRPLSGAHDFAESLRVARSLVGGEGVVVLAGRTLTIGEESFGIIVFRADDEASAKALVESDPAVAAGVMSAELFPFSLALLGA